MVPPRATQSAKCLDDENVKETMGAKMKATVFHAPGDIRLEEVPRPHAGAGEAVIRITLTTICGTDLHILRGEYCSEAWSRDRTRTSRRDRRTWRRFVRIQNQRSRFGRREHAIQPP